MNTAIKYAALGVAAYVVYRYLESLPMFQAAAAEPASPPVQPAQPIAAPLPEPKTPAEQFTRAATDETWGRNAPVSLAASADEWNWYRANATGINQPDPLTMGFDSTTRSYPITARQYWDALRTAQITLQGMAGWNAYEMVM